jgi:SAM-dependent methyltransferase
MMGLREAAKRAWYFGFKYECSVCGSYTRSRKTFSFDLPVLKDYDVIGGEYYPNDDCPICYANQRSRLLAAYLTEHLDIQDGWDVLHVAPELALYRYVFESKTVNYYPADLYPEKYKHVPGVRKVDINAIPFRSGTFDLILCNHVLEHVPDDRQAMRELRRVLRAGGTAVLQVPLSTKLPNTVEDPSITDPTERERRFGQFDHVRIYAENDYLRRLREAGFRVELLSAEEVAGPDGPERRDLNPRERLVVARSG